VILYSIKTNVLKKKSAFYDLDVSYTANTWFIIVMYEYVKSTLYTDLKEAIKCKDYPNE
jgi:hypothetical protein